MTAASLFKLGLFLCVLFMPPTLCLLRVVDRGDEDIRIIDIVFILLVLGLSCGILFIWGAMLWGLWERI